MSMELMTENHKQQNSTLFVWMLFFVNLPQVSGPKYYIQYNVKWNASQLLFFEKALLLIPMTNVTLRSLIINQKFQYQAPSLSFTNGTTSIQGPSFCVKRCCSSKYHRHMYTWAIKNVFRVWIAWLNTRFDIVMKTLNFVSGLYNYWEWFFQAMHTQ